MTIKFYKTNDPYGFLNNFFPSRMFVYDRWWSTVEHAYQAQKTLKLNEYDDIWHAATPRIARDLGQKVSIRSDWDNIKYSVMKDCVKAKFIQNATILQKLAETGSEDIVEDSPIDYYWGCGKDNSGKNMLGKILVEVREELTNEDPSFLLIDAPCFYPMKT
jgi:N-glycosidase YbiA